MGSQVALFYLGCTRLKPILRLENLHLYVWKMRFIQQNPQHNGCMSLVCMLQDF